MRGAIEVNGCPHQSESVRNLFFRVDRPYPVGSKTIWVPNTPDGVPTTAWVGSCYMAGIWIEKCIKPESAAHH